MCLPWTECASFHLVNQSSTSDLWLSHSSHSLILLTLFLLSDYIRVCHRGVRILLCLSVLLSYFCHIFTLFYVHMVHWLHSSTVRLSLTSTLFYKQLLHFVLQINKRKGNVEKKNNNVRSRLIVLWHIVLSPCCSFGLVTFKEVYCIYCTFKCRMNCVKRSGLHFAECFCCQEHALHDLSTSSGSRKWKMERTVNLDTHSIPHSVFSLLKREIQWHSVCGFCYT